MSSSFILTQYNDDYIRLTELASDKPSKLIICQVAKCVFFCPVRKALYVLRTFAHDGRLLRNYVCIVSKVSYASIIRLLPFIKLVDILGASNS